MKKVVIFDMDGVIVDTEPAYRKLNTELYKRFSMDISEEEQFTFAGISSDKLWTRLRKEYSLEPEVEELIDMARSSKHNYLSTFKDLKPIEGIEELFKSLKKNSINISMGSSSPKKNIDVVLHRLNLRQYFDYIVSGEDIINGKPDPDIFLKSAEYFNVSPDSCTVVEDSNNGLRAAKSAGMKCVGFINPNTGKQDLSFADIIIESFDKCNIQEIIKLANK